MSLKDKQRPYSDPFRQMRRTIMTNFKKILLGGAAALMLSASGGMAHARSEICIVNDPNPPLNVRAAPNGRIIGALADSDIVSILQRRGLWAYVAKKKLKGWIYQSLIDCEGETK
jgi:Bacterial SH3 domain